MRLMYRNVYLAKLDLKDSYFLIPINKSSRKYLRFSYKNQLFEFNCLPFGLSTAPFVFTKVLKPVAEHLRSKEFLSVFYLDDILLYGRSKEECRENVVETIKL